jgi:hypothetical protein
MSSIVADHHHMLIESEDRKVYFFKTIFHRDTIDTMRRFYEMKKKIFSRSNFSHEVFILITSYALIQVWALKISPEK